MENDTPGLLSLRVHMKLHMCFLSDQTTSKDVRNPRKL